MKKVLLAVSAFTLLQGTLSADTGEALFDAKCAKCHIKVRPTPEMKKVLIAPPAMGVMFHVKEAFDGNKSAATAFVAEYALSPSKAKAKCMPQAINRFGLMPSQKGAVSEAELALIADYLYENFPPKAFRPGPMR